MDRENEAWLSRIAEFWGQLEAQLSELPTPKREEFLLETRAHVEAMVAARRMEGLSEEVAWQEAMEAFGDPREVGGALYSQWATSGHLESEGTPLSKRELFWKFARPVAPNLVFYAVFTYILDKKDGAFKVPVYAFLLVVLMGIGLVLFRRKGGQWTPATISAYLFILVQLALAVVDLQWRSQLQGTAFQRWNDTWQAPIMIGFCVVWMWLYKRDTIKRPWQFAARYKQSPVAAEQEYRLNPVIGLTTGVLMGCMGALSMGQQFFGMGHALGICALLIGGAFAVNWWLRR